MKDIKKEEIESVIISYDEKPSIQVIGNIYPNLMPVEGHYSTIARDYEYKRHGILSLLAGINLISGRINYKVFEKHKSWEFIQFLKELELIYPREKIKILMDNYKILLQGKLENTWKLFLINLNLYSHPNMLHG